MRPETPHSRLRLFFRLAFLLCWGPGALYLLIPSQMSAIFGAMTFASPALYLAVFAPTIAALACAHIEGRPAFADLLSRLLRWRVSLIWYLAATIGIAALALAPRFLISSPEGLLESVAPNVLLAATLSDPGPIGEELGWRGFALPRLQERYNGLVAALILGAIWSLWHVPAFFLAGLPQSQIPFAPWLVSTMALAILMAWLTNRARGAILPAVLAHWAWNRSADLAGDAAWPTAILLATAATALVAQRGHDLDRAHNPGVPA
jgi:membrane protease YdiL (CAAX protease family)